MEGGLPRSSIPTCEVLTASVTFLTSSAGASGATASRTFAGSLRLDSVSASRSAVIFIPSTVTLPAASTATMVRPISSGGDSAFSVAFPGAASFRPAASITIQIFVPTTGSNLPLRSHSRDSKSRPATSGISMTVSSLFNTLTRYPTASAAYFPSSITLEPVNTQVNGGASFLVLRFDINRYAGTRTSSVPFSHSQKICTGGPCGGCHFLADSDHFTGSPGSSPIISIAR